MDRELIERINSLARKGRTEGLTEMEKGEQAALRARYLREFREGMKGLLDQVYLQGEDGTYEKLRQKTQE